MTGQKGGQAGDVTWFSGDDGEGVTFAVHVQPRAAKNEVVGLHGDAVKVRLTAPPAEGAANELLLRFLAETLRIARGRVSLVSGRTSREKKVRVVGLRREELLERLGLVGERLAKKR